MKKAKEPELPKPKSELGYSLDEVLAICRERKIHHKRFWKAFGINTVGGEMVNGKMETRIYVCDVERALYRLGKGGKYHAFD